MHLIRCLLFVVLLAALYRLLSLCCVWLLSSNFHLFVK
jgi:hypothetical protein